MGKKIMTPYEEHHMVRLLVNKFSRDETIVALNEKLKKVEFENGVLKSEIAEMKDKMKVKHPYGKKDDKIKQHEETIRSLQQECRDLKYQLTASGVPIPKKYL